MPCSHVPLLHGGATEAAALLLARRAVVVGDRAADVVRAVAFFAIATVHAAQHLPSASAVGRAVGCLCGPRFDRQPEADHQKARADRQRRTEQNSSHGFLLKGCVGKARARVELC